MTPHRIPIPRHTAHRPAQVVVADVEDRDDALELIHEELIVLSQKPKDKPATTLITFPPKLFEQLRAADGMVDIAEDELGNFEEFLELAVDIAPFLSFQLHGAEPTSPRAASLDHLKLLCSRLRHPNEEEEENGP